jgi:flagellar basal-body rod protein FlgC
MRFDNILAVSNISTSGLSAERLRMEVVASNIANAHSTRGPDGGPYRRQDVLFETVLSDQSGGLSMSSHPLQGVRIAGVQEDPSELPRVYSPGHPDADGQGYITMPNVSLPLEMVNLMTATRAYEANLKVLQAVRKQLEQTIGLLR